MSNDRGLVADRPIVPEGISKAALAMDPPGNLVLHNGGPRRRPCRKGSIEDRIGVLDKELDPRGRHPSTGRARLGRIVRIDLMEEEGGTSDLQPDDTAEVPYGLCSERSLVPVFGSRRVRDDEHDRDCCIRQRSTPFVRQGIGAWRQCRDGTPVLVRSLSVGHCPSGDTNRQVTTFTFRRAFLIVHSMARRTRRTNRMSTERSHGDDPSSKGATCATA